MIWQHEQLSDDVVRSKGHRRHVGSGHNEVAVALLAATAVASVALFVPIVLGAVGTTEMRFVTVATKPTMAIEITMMTAPF